MTEHTSTDDKVVFGFWIYLMSDCILFAGLFATYAVLHTSTFGTPSPAELFSLPYVLVETLLLLTSSFTVGLAMLAAYSKKKELALVGLAVTLTLGLSFLGMELNEFKNFVAEGHSWRESAFLSSFFTLVGTHGFHVFLGSMWMFAVTAHIYLRGFTEGTMRKLMCMSLFWHFLDIVWIFIFTFVFLWPVI
ncbi:MAG: cytochrome o ubiquinol oxidase subunit III [bacterium]|nr:cytochrome o ubiquinol oxidase subunit III [bacterium]